MGKLGASLWLRLGFRASSAPVSTHRPHHNQDEAGWTERRQAPMAPTPDGIETSRALSSPCPGNPLAGSQGPDLEPPQ